MALTKISGDVLQQPINIGVATVTSVNVGSAVTINSSGINVTGVVTATTFSGNATSATLATNAQGLTGTPNITVGSIIAASATFSGNISVAGTVTYEDVTNVDSVGVITARSGLVVGAGASVVGLSTFSGGIQVGATTSITVGSAFIRNNQIGLGATTTTGRNAGVGTALGSLIYNSSTSTVQYYDGTGWFDTNRSFVQATGGTVSDYTSGSTIYRSHIFTSSGTFSVTSTGPGTVEYLVVAGGGGGGSDNGTGAGCGGGGAGGFRTGTGFSISIGSYPVTVGSGGISAFNLLSTNGSDSVLGPPAGTEGTSKITSTGGGRGAGYTPAAGVYYAASAGGSGGGGGGIYSQCSWCWKHSTNITTTRK